MIKKTTAPCVRISSFIILLVFSLSTIIFQGVSSPQYDYWPTIGWQTSSLEKQRINSSYIDDLKDYINENDLDIHGFLIVRNGYLIEEEYFGSDASNVIVPVYSITKSITSTLIGIAIDKGYLEGVDQKILDFFPNRTIENLDEDKQNITIAHLLTMTSGLEWNEWYVSYFDPSADFRKMRDTVNDWVQYVLDKPMVGKPGTQFNYNGGTVHLLSAIIQEVYGNALEAFAKEYLFNPLNITNYAWDKDPQGITQGETALRLTARDMAKLGYLYLHNGTWEDSQILPKEWIYTATDRLVLSTQSAPYSYGYLWWITNPSNAVRHFMARGWNGQQIYVVPEKDLIVVFTSYEPRFGLLLGKTILEQFIIPSTEYSAAKNSNYSNMVIVFTAIFIALKYKRREKENL
ncbi:MAG: serine hydrolase domain-containing protein [Candidatus Hodarchaeales archaeon]